MKARIGVMNASMKSITGQRTRSYVDVTACIQSPRIQLLRDHEGLYEVSFEAAGYGGLYGVRYGGHMKLGIYEGVSIIY